MKLTWICIVGAFLLVQQSLCLTQKDSALYQLHHLFSDDRYTYQRSGSGMGFFSKIIISIAVGVLFFFGVMYYCKYRRQGSVTIPCLGTFGNRNQAQYSQQQPVNAQYNPQNNTRPVYAQQDISYGNNPYAGQNPNQNYNQGQDRFHPSNNQYPVI